MKFGKIGWLAPLAMLCFLSGTSGHTLSQESRAPSPPTPLAAPAFDLTIKGIRQGFFKGDGNPTLIRGLSVDLQATVPYSVATGQATGKHQYKPITIIKEWGASSPQILAALATNEILPVVQLEYRSMNNKAMLVLNHVIKLTDAVIVGVHHHPETGLLDGSTDKHALEEVSFTFRKIEVEDKIGQTKFADDLSLGGH